jgi:hypothetical protein
LPHNITKLLQELGWPDVSRGITTHSDEHVTILRAAGNDVGGKANGGGSGHISNPVAVRLQFLLLLPLAILPIIPQFNEVVTATWWKLLAVIGFLPWCWSMKLPGTTAGSQLTALQSVGWALLIFTSHWPFLV